MKTKHRPVKTDPPKPSRITDGNGKTYHPTKAPEGLCKCGVMLQLTPKENDYIFPSMTRAIHAKEHTIKYLKSLGLPFDPNDYVIEVVT